MSIDWTAVETAEDRAAQALEEAKRQARAALLAHLDAQAALLTEGVPLSEQLSWAVKREAAAAYVAGAATSEDTAMLQSEAAETGEALDDLAQRILGRAAAHKIAAGQIAGVRRRVQTAIDAADTPAQVAAVLAALAP